MDGQNINWTENFERQISEKIRLFYPHNKRLRGFFLLFLMHASEQEEADGNFDESRPFVARAIVKVSGQWFDALWLVSWFPDEASDWSELTDLVSQCRLLIRADWWSQVSRKLGPRKTRQNILGSIILKLEPINAKRELLVSGKSPMSKREILCRREPKKRKKCVI